MTLHKARLQVPGSRILIVEDNEELRDIYARFLDASGFRVRTVATASEAFELAPSCDLAMLDVALPDEDGWTLAERLRDTFPDVAFLFVTAMGERGQRLQGFGVGADDYLVKPIDLEELRARVTAILRRRQGPAPLQLGRLTVDLSGQVVWLDGQLIKLTTIEYDLLALFVQHPLRVWSRDDLLSRVWGNDRFVTHRAVDVRIRHLRQAIQDEAAQPTFIDTVRGRGYRWIMESDDTRARPSSRERIETKP